MLTAQKKDSEKVRRMVDYQELNSQCFRETHHCPSPFKLACQVPANTKKTVVDATDGYHSIELDEESKPLTTFITEWGRYRYCRLPQGFVAAGDAYTRRYDEIIKDVKNKVKCIDDTLLYSESIEEAFFQTWDYLKLCRDNGITLNLEKFQFCQDTVMFAGLKITKDGIQPADNIIDAIKNFPAPKDLSGARAWFGLVNQITWAYANAPAMQPFRDIVKANAKFEWNENLQQLFKKSKQMLIEQSIDGIKAYDPERRTCLQTDWSKEGLGYLLLQQHCKCDISKAPICCKDGWKLVFAGSRFTQPAETRYSPTEGEALAVAWALEHARFFVLGCKNLIVSTDHKALTGILQDRDLASIRNPRILNIKERTLQFSFRIQYNPGKWHRAPDAFSRNPSPHTVETISNVSDEVNELVCAAIDECEANVEAHIAAVLSNINSVPDTKVVLTIENIREAAENDSEYKNLVSAIINGFPERADPEHAAIRPYWNVRDSLSVIEGVAVLNDRLVIPSSLRANILRNLHSAHQGVSKMSARALQTVYWPGLEKAIRNTRYNCQKCNELAPSQTKEPIISAPPPKWPFQQICMDYFKLGHHTYLACADRFSGWISIIHFPGEAKTTDLIKACRDIFVSYGSPEEISSDGGPQFKAHKFAEFLDTWGIKHRLSSAEYPQSNGRAEAAVKSAKKIIRDNANSNGSLQNDKAAKAILQYRNTPLADIGLSPAQILLHRQLRDAIPANPNHYKPHREWAISAEEREKAVAKTNQSTQNYYNKNAHLLEPLETKTAVRIQSKGKWDKTGSIVEILPNRKYRIRVDGSGRTTLRNRRFIKEERKANLNTPIPSAEYSNMPILRRMNQNIENNTNPDNIQPQQAELPDIDQQPLIPAQQSPIAAQPIAAQQATAQQNNAESPGADQQRNHRTPQALQRLRDFNQPGIAEDGHPRRRRLFQE